MQIDGDITTTINFIDSLKIPYIAASFGGCESIVDQPAILSYWYSFVSLVYVVILMIWHYLSCAMVLFECDPMKSFLVGPLCFYTLFGILEILSIWWDTSIWWEID